MADFSDQGCLLPNPALSHPSVAAPSPQLHDAAHSRMGRSPESYSSPAVDRQRGASIDAQHQQTPDDHLSYPPSLNTRASFEQPPPQSFDSPFAHAEECLSFSPPVSTFALLDESSKPVDVLLSAQLAGLFSREGQLSDYLAPEHNGPVPYSSPVLICYRRNRISIAGHLAIPRGLRYVLTPNAQQLPILSQELVLSAFESHENGYGGTLVQTLVQRDGPPSAVAESEADGVAPQPIPLTPEAAEEATHDQEYTIFPFEWKKLQFRRATVNNGKGPERQRFFLVSVKIIATLADGQKLSICEATSNSIIVRGRGPQNFAKGIGSPEHGKVYRSKSLNATLDGRLRKPDRRSTRNSLLRQSLSRKAPCSSGVSAAMLQSLSSYEGSPLLSVSEPRTNTPITPPITPFANATLKQDADPGSPSDHVHRDSASPEAPFRLPSAQPKASRQSQEPQSRKTDLEDMFKQTFNLPGSGLQIHMPLSPPHLDKSYGVGAVAVTSESPPMLPNTPMSHSEDGDGSRTITTNGAPLDLSYLDQHSYTSDKRYVTMSEVSSAPPLDDFTISGGLMASYPRMQDTPTWQHASSMAQGSHSSWPFA